MTTYRVTRLETDSVTYRVDAESVEDAITALAEWSLGDAVPGVREVGRSFQDVEDEERWEAYPEEG